MPRKHIFQLLSEQKMNVSTEYYNLHQLFSVEKNVSSFYSGYTVQKFIDDHAFREIPMSGTYLSILDMREALGIGDRVCGSIQLLYLFCELIRNIIEESEPVLQRCADRDMMNSYHKQVSILKKNMSLFLDKTGYRWLELEDHHYIVVENNKVAIEAAELVEDESVAIQIMEYNHYALEGNLEEKRKILFAIGKYLEPVLKESTGTVYDKIAEDAGFLLNNLHIRHNNRTGKNENDFVKGTTDKQLEQWYDKTYATLTGAIVVHEWKGIHDEIGKLKTEHGWKR